MHQEFTEFYIFDETTSISTKNDRISATGIHGQQDYHFFLSVVRSQINTGSVWGRGSLTSHLFSDRRWFATQILVHGEISKIFRLKIPIILKK